MLADPARGLLYLLRQDKNIVSGDGDGDPAHDSGAGMRTGNTPMQMALTPDLNFLVVGNDNSQIATVLDLNLLATVPARSYFRAGMPRAP